MKTLYFLILLILAPALGADLVYLGSGQVIEGDIRRVSPDVVEIQTDLGRQLIQRSAITRIVFDKERTDAIPLQMPVKKHRPLYLLPIAAFSIILSLDAFRSAQDITEQIEYYEYWNAHTSPPFYVDTDRMRRARDRQKLLGYSGMALSAVLVGFVIWDVTVTAAPNQVQLSYRF